MDASTAPSPKRCAPRFAPKVLGLITSALFGMMLLATARGESVALTGKSPVPADGGAAVEVDALAGLGLQTLDATPAAAAALQLTVDAVTPPADRPGLDRRRAAEAPPPEPNEAAAVKLAAVPEPAALVLGLTSTLILGSLSWKRRLAHPSRA